MGIGVNVMKLRELKNLSQQDLEAVSKVPQSSISRIEKGIYRNPGIETVRKLATALGVLVDDLLDYSN